MEHSSSPETSPFVFYPQVSDLLNLANYIEAIEAQHPDIGICKLIPPSGWYNREYDIDAIVIPIKYPIKQLVSGHRGAYHVTSLETKPTNLQEFAENARKEEDRNGLKGLSSSDKNRLFWKSLGKGADPVYGADIEGTLFNSYYATSNCGMQNWSLSTGLNDMLRLIPNSIPGVNTTMLYAGAWRAMFAYHVEDLDLYSINFLHYGAPKSWYSVPPSYRNRFESLAESHYQEDSNKCREYLRHKTKLFSPKIMRECGMVYHTVVQHPGEFVVTFPGSYHAGYNHGFNLAEATNFATERWLQLGRKAKRCLCRPNSVYLDIDAIEERYYDCAKDYKHGNPANPEKESHSQLKLDLSRLERKRTGQNILAQGWADPDLDQDPDQDQDHDQQGSDSLACTSSPLASISSVVSKGTLLAASTRDTGTKHVMSSKGIDRSIELIHGGAGAGAGTGVGTGINSPSSSCKTPTPCTSAKKRKPNPSQIRDCAAKKKTSPIKRPQNHITDGNCASNNIKGVVALNIPAKKVTELKLNETIVSVGKHNAVNVVNIGLVGVITSIEGNLGRLHVKGQRRDEDVWVPLQACCYVNGAP